MFFFPFPLFFSVFLPLCGNCLTKTQKPFCFCTIFSFLLIHLSDFPFFAFISCFVYIDVFYSFYCFLCFVSPSFLLSFFFCSVVFLLYCYLNHLFFFMPLVLCFFWKFCNTPIICLIVWFVCFSFAIFQFFLCNTKNIYTVHIALLFIFSFSFVLSMFVCDR